MMKLKASILAVSLALSGAAWAKEMPQKIDFSQAMSIAKMPPEVDLLTLQQSRIESNRTLDSAALGVQHGIRGLVGAREYKSDSDDWYQLYLVSELPIDLHDQQGVIDTRSALQTQANQLRKAFAQGLFRLNVLDAYADVLRSDAEYRVANEQMAIDYIRFDKIKERHAVKRVSDPDLAQAEANYQSSFLAFRLAGERLKQTRMILAEVMGYPNTPPSDVLSLDWKPYQERLKTVVPEDIGVWFTQLAEKNPEIMSYDVRAKALEQKIKQAQLALEPSLTARSQLGTQTDWTNKEGRWALSLNFSMPLSDAGQTDAQVAILRTEQASLKVKKRQALMRFRTELQRIYTDLIQIKSRLQSLKVRQTFSDWYLDKNRALYEMERAATLGDSFVEMSRVQLEELDINIDLAKNLERLDVLLGDKR